MPINNEYEDLDKQLRDLLQDFRPGELHENLKNTQNDAQSNINKQEMIQELMNQGIPLQNIPMDNLPALQQLYDQVVHDINPGDFSPDEQQRIQTLLSSNNNITIKLAGLINFLDMNQNFNLADKIEKETRKVLAATSFEPKYALFPELDIKSLAGEPQDLMPQAPIEEAPIEEPLEPEIPDEEIEDVISPKDIDALLDKLEAVMDAMGEDFDPDLVPFAKKILTELLDKFEQIDSSGATEEISEGIPEEIPEEMPAEMPLPETQPKYEHPELAPKMASILHSSIKIANKSDDLYKIKNNQLSTDMDHIFLGLQKLFDRFM